MMSKEKKKKKKKELNDVFDKFKRLALGAFSFVEKKHDMKQQQSEFERTQNLYNGKLDNNGEY